LEEIQQERNFTFMQLRSRSRENYQLFFVLPLYKAIMNVAVFIYSTNCFIRNRRMCAINVRNNSLEISATEIFDTSWRFFHLCSISSPYLCSYCMLKKIILKLIKTEKMRILKKMYVKNFCYRNFCAVISNIGCTHSSFTC